MPSHQKIIEQITKRLEAWDYKIDRLESRVKGLPDELRASAHEKYQKLKQYQETLGERERALKATTEQAIHDVEDSFEEVWDTFKLLFEEVEKEEVEDT